MGESFSGIIDDAGRTNGAGDGGIIDRWFMLVTKSGEGEG